MQRNGPRATVELRHGCPSMSRVISTAIAMIPARHFIALSGQHRQIAPSPISQIRSRGLSTGLTMMYQSVAANTASRPQGDAD